MLSLLLSIVSVRETRPEWNTYERRVERGAVDADAGIGILIGGWIRSAVDADAGGGEPRVAGEREPRGVVLAGADGLAGHRVRHDRPAVLATGRRRHRWRSRVGCLRLRSGTNCAALHICCRHAARAYRWHRRAT